MEFYVCIVPVSTEHKVNGIDEFIMLRNYNVNRK